MSVKRYECTNGGASWCQGCYTMEERDDGDYLLATDYEALAAELESVKALWHERSATVRLRDIRIRELEAALAHIGPSV